MKLQGEKSTKKDPPVIDINITAYIPDNWIDKKEQKMIEYKRLADVTTLKELELLEEEWTDRFGNIPTEVKRLFTIIKLRLLAVNIEINLIREMEGNIRIFSDYNLEKWRKYQNKLPKHLLKRLRWIKAPQTSKNGKSIIILNCSGLFAQEQLNILEELFLKIAEI